MEFCFSSLRNSATDLPPSVQMGGRVAGHESPEGKPRQAQRPLWRLHIDHRQQIFQLAPAFVVPVIDPATRDVALQTDSDAADALPRLVEDAAGA